MWYDPFIDTGIIPNWAIRLMVRQQLHKYSKRISKIDDIQLLELQQTFRKECLQNPIAINTSESNQQHYNIPPSVFEMILSKIMKYSGSIWADATNELYNADRDTNSIYIDRALIENGHHVLDLGCGWGSLSMDLARRYEKSQVTAVTNSTQQAQYINRKISKEQLSNLRVEISDINNYQPPNIYDRVISIEMFEHMRNPNRLFDRLEQWLKPNGFLFFQVFSHKNFPQFFDDTSKSWMSRHFFTGGMMPYKGLYGDLHTNLTLRHVWDIPGTNYHKSLESWLQRLDINTSEILNTLRFESPSIDANTYLNRYKLFLIFCSELFRFNEGQDWHLMNYLNQK